MGKLSATVGGVTVAAGRKEKVFWHASSRVGGEPVRIPLVVINGLESGPTVWVQAGVHGDEYHSIAAAMELAAIVRPEDVSGRIVIATVANPPAMENLTPTSGVDSVNLNYAFPGSTTGTTSQVLAAALLEEIAKVADYAIDLHGGGNEFTVPPFTWYYTAEGGEGLRIAKAFGIEILLKTGPEDKWVDGRFYAEVSKRGVPAILAVAGFGPRLIREPIDTLINGVEGVLAELGVLLGATNRTRPQYITVAIGKDSRPKTTHGGFARVAVKAGCPVSKGELLATIHDFFGDEAERIVAPTDGIILDLLQRPVVGPGQLVALIGKRVSKNDAQLGDPVLHPTEES